MLVAGKISEVLHSPAGDAIRSIKFDATADPELAQLVDERFQAPRRAYLIALLQRGVERGEVRPDAVNEQVADVLPAVLMHRLVMLRRDVTEADLCEIMELVVIPLVEAR
jgi:hypothetical protein